MTVEIVNYITDLDVTNPKGSDKIAEGDNHIRNIKLALTESFPNIDAPVLATPDELNNLQGLAESVPPALPEVPTEEGSMLVNKSNKWSEDVTMKVLGDKLYIPALAGIGKLNLYVDENGEVLASEMATDPTMQHDLNFHTDVDFQGTPERDDVLIHDGVAWRAKRATGGSTMNPIQQPNSVGSFTTDKSQAQAWECRSQGNLTLSVPAGMKFILVNITSFGGGNIPVKSIAIDGVPVWASVEFDNVTEAEPLFNETHMGNPHYVARSSITMSSTASVAVVHGYFVEDK